MQRLICNVLDQPAAVYTVIKVQMHLALGCCCISTESASMPDMIKCSVVIKKNKQEASVYSEK